MEFKALLGHMVNLRPFVISFETVSKEITVSSNRSQWHWAEISKFKFKTSGGGGVGAARHMCSARLCREAVA